MPQSPSCRSPEPPPPPPRLRRRPASSRVTRRTGRGTPTRVVQRETDGPSRFSDPRPDDASTKYTRPTPPNKSCNPKNARERVGLLLHNQFTLRALAHPPFLYYYYYYCKPCNRRFRSFFCFNPHRLTKKSLVRQTLLARQWPMQVSKGALARQSHRRDK